MVWSPKSVRGADNWSHLPSAPKPPRDPSRYHLRTADYAGGKSERKNTGRPEESKTQSPNKDSKTSNSDSPALPKTETNEATTTQPQSTSGEQSMTSGLKLSQRLKVLETAYAVRNEM